MSSPVICFGQQPCGFYPKRFLVAKMQTARKLQQEIGGEIVFFFHDSDHDPRETKTILRHRGTKEPAQLNFAYENKTQRKFSPLYLKKIAAGWQDKTRSQLTNYLDHSLIDIFKKVKSDNVADFCLEMYREMGLIEGMKIMRSSDPAFREAAIDIPDYFVDVPYEGEIVRARVVGDELKVHEGGDVYTTVPKSPYGKAQISPARDTRLPWMQSVVKCTHYVSGAGEQAYLRKEDAPDIQFVTRAEIEQSDEAYVELN